MRDRLSRRRFIGIFAAAAGLTPSLSSGMTRAAAHAVTWRGRALGASAELILHHHDPEVAKQLVKRVVVEIERLEQIFSLYMPGSSLSALNSTGALATPPIELVELLKRSREIWSLSSGVFDPTVQPLWSLYVQHFSHPGAALAGPPPGDLVRVLSLVGFGGLMFDRSRIAFAKRGMAITLNGIAQGFITDRIIALLHNAGVVNTLADIGEIRAMGYREGGSAWRVGIAGTSHVADLVDRAVATSSPDGFRFAGTESPAHLLNPLTGLSAARYRSVSVLAPDATTADALSTACSFLDPDEIGALLGEVPGVEVHLQTVDGRRLHLV